MARTNTHATVKMETKKLASDEFTACKELAKVESIIPISLVKRFSMRPATKGSQQQVCRENREVHHPGELCHGNGRSLEQL